MCIFCVVRCSHTHFPVQIFGGNGYNREYPVEKLMRDAKIFMVSIQLVFVSIYCDVYIANHTYRVICPCVQCTCSYVPLILKELESAL